MAMKQVAFSDLSGGLIPEDDKVKVIVHSHPDLDGPVQLDAAAYELDALAKAATDYVLVEIQSGEDSISKAVDLAVFSSLFKTDVKAALAGAAPFRSGSGGTKPVKRSTEELNALRDWGRKNGWPDLSDRGRVPREIEEAYAKVQAARPT